VLLFGSGFIAYVSACSMLTPEPAGADPEIWTIELP
jgi:hypothetical protein